VFIEELTWPEVRDAIAGGKTTAIYYAGSTEQNGPHMATGKHNVVARYVAERIAGKLGNALVYPVMPFAPTGDADQKTGHMRFPGSVSVSEATFAAVAREVAQSARAAGFRSIVLMGDHGGGQAALRNVADELDRQWSAGGVRVLYIGAVYFCAEDMAEKELARRGLRDGAHAGIIDTSELMFVDRPGEMLRRNLIGRAPRGAEASGVDGDPRRANYDLGRLFVGFKVDCAVEQIRALSARPQ
jgi:creatinine amidohydrolase/Fe(II)-dependent formamide hydrolase-like protein